MPHLRVVYRLARITHTGDGVGDDWTIYLHTGAGLVRVASRVVPAGDDPRERVIGVREVEIGAPVTFANESWWVSATEHDSKFPDRGAGLYTPVALPLEPEAEVWRSLVLEVAESGGSPDTSRRAELRVDLYARVELAGDVPAPKLDAVPLAPDADVPRPTRTAGELPEAFTVDLHGVGFDVMVPVTARRKHDVSLLAGADSPIAEALRTFLKHHTNTRPPASFTPRAVVYELSNAAHAPFWIGDNSSMGHDNHALLIAAFAAAAPPLGSESEGFEVQPSLLRHLLAYKHTIELGPAAAAIAGLVAALTTEHPEQSTVERAFFMRTSIIDDISGEWTYVTFIDPTPFSGPEASAWMLVWTDAWVE